MVSPLRKQCVVASSRRKAFDGWHSLNPSKDLRIAKIVRLHQSIFFFTSPRAIPVAKALAHL